MAAAAFAEADVPDAARETLAETPTRPGEDPPELEDKEDGGAVEALKVLFVDDEEDFVRTIAERMGMRDVDSQVALDGQQALHILEDAVPDVMVLDLRMPGIDGLEVLRRAKALYPQMGVVIMTGHGSDADAAEARRLGASAYLRKPVDINRLLAAVREAGRARSAVE
jgi:DNA-binding NtrC family response regulator